LTPKESPIQDLYEQLCHSLIGILLTYLFLNDKHPPVQLREESGTADGDCLSVLIGKMGLLIRT
jgi:hypothetical protein